MLMLIGKGGEGKSRIGLVMRSLLGDSMNTTSIQRWRATGSAVQTWKTSS